jgi:hypothetical protein
MTVGLGSDFLNMIPKVQLIKEKLDRLDKANFKTLSGSAGY